MLSPEISGEAGAEYRTCFMTRDVLTELSSDFTLPDYYPEIRKLLRIETNVSPAGRYIGGGAVEFSGRVDYDMIYTAADGAVVCAPLGSDFSFEVPVSRPEGALESEMIEAVADSEAENVSGRVISPRKLNIKCRLRSRVRCYCASEYAPNVSGGQRIERLTEEIVCADSRRYVGEELSLSSEIPCDTEELFPLYGHAAAEIKEISVAGGLVSIAGEAHMNIACRERGETKMICENLPFSCEIETDTHGDSASEELWTAFPYVTETDVSLEDGKISARVTLVCHADLHRNSQLTVLRDIYSVVGEESVTTEPLDYQVAVAAGCETLKMRHELRPGNIQLSDSSRVVDSGASASIDGCTFENGKINLTGKCRVTAVVESSGDFSVLEETVPLSLSVSPIHRPEGELGCACRATVCSLGCVLEGGAVKLSGDVYLSYAAYDRRSVEAVKGASFRESVASDGGIIVCYPPFGETLWGVSKRYRVPLSSVAAANDLPLSAPSSPLPASVKYMIICK